MTERLTFPDHDVERTLRDCEDLKSILLSHMEAHCAWLRALTPHAAENTQTIPASVWSEPQIDAVLRVGFAAALERGTISRTLLRSLANDPEMLESLLERVVAEGDPTVWFGEDIEHSVGDSVDIMTNALLKELALLGSGPIRADQAPSVQSSELGHLFAAVPFASAHLRTWRIEVNVVSETVLTLRFQNKTWGKLIAHRRSATEIEVVSGTGVFLSQPLPSQLRLRAAASSEPASGSSTSPIEIQAVASGLLIRITTRTGS